MSLSLSGHKTNKSIGAQKPSRSVKDLNEAQLAKKRAHDRLSQLKKRQSAKEHIQMLETRLNDLERESESTKLVLGRNQDLMEVSTLCRYVEVVCSSVAY